MSTNTKPTTHQRDLAKLPRALAPLIERPQWAVWRWTQRDNGTWQKPPFMAAEPRAARQHQGSQHVERLRHGAGRCAGRARRRDQLHSDRAGFVRRH